MLTQTLTRVFFYFDNQLNAQLLYSITIFMLRYNPPHVSSINMPIFRRTDCIITASGIVTLCKRLYSMPDESRLQSTLLSSGILYCTVHRAMIPDAVIIQFVLLKMGMLMLKHVEDCNVTQILLQNKVIVHQVGY